MSKLQKLAILQLEQYDTRRYLAHRRDVGDEVTKRLRWTMRMKLTRILSYGMGVVGANTLIGFFVKMYERYIWWWVKKRIHELKSKGLRVVAITGSYGKTSVKHYVYELLRYKYRVVATPESFNTVLGIAKCLKWEVDQNTQVFLVEVGAYRIGDITHLLAMVRPDIGVLTGIARQHLERFGSFENIKKAKGEIAEYMRKVGGKLVANGSDEVVKDVVKQAIWYVGGERNEINLNGAKEVARLLGVTKLEVRVRQPKNRFEMTTTRYGMRVVDDSFSSNDKGFTDAVEYLGKQSQYTRILVSPGLVELGSVSRQMHEQLGKGVIGNADIVILVGKNERTESLEKGIGGKVKVMYIDKTLEFMRVVKSLKLKKEPLVLLENDVTENY